MKAVCDIDFFSVGVMLVKRRKEAVIYGTFNATASHPGNIGNLVFLIMTLIIGGSRGHHWHTPQGSRFFHFDIQILRNVAASGVGAPYKVGAPPREILDLPLLMMSCIDKY